MKIIKQKVLEAPHKAHFTAELDVFGLKQAFDFEMTAKGPQSVINLKLMIVEPNLEPGEEPEVDSKTCKYLPQGL